MALHPDVRKFEPAPPYPHPWLRLQLLIRTMTATRWDSGQWPMVKGEIGKAQ